SVNNSCWVSQHSWGLRTSLKQGWRHGRIAAGLNGKTYNLDHGRRQQPMPAVLQHN
ncbi:MAG: hypothetical protein ACI9YG_002262, partial [Candidatus Azotimanducaceae bacterium]